MEFGKLCSWEKQGNRVVFHLTALLAVCTAFLVDGSFNPFLYFRF